MSGKPRIQDSGSVIGVYIQCELIVFGRYEMANKEKLEKWLSENSLTVLFIILFVAVISAVMVVGVYWFYFNGVPVRSDPAPWGQFGDFFGGTLNPIFGFLSVMALLAALVIQSRELKISSEELKNSALALNAQNRAIAHQSFEQTFFSWLESYRDMLGSVEHVTNEREFNGGRALRRWWVSSLTDNYLGSADPNIPGLAKVALGQWERLYRDNEYQLDSLFRNLYRLILWIDSQHGSRMSEAQKWFYISIVRAQLSWIEMVYLFYNGHTERGRNFKKLIEKYALFDNLNFDSDAVIAHIKEHGHDDVRYADSAYDSRLARKALGLPESTEETLAMAVV